MPLTAGTRDTFSPRPANPFIMHTLPRLSAALPLILFPLLAIASSASPAAPDLVLVGDPGNPDHDAAFDNLPYAPPRGSVATPFRIAPREVSNTDYAAFLNACATRDDALGLFDERMRIVRTGTPGAWRYAPSPDTANNGVAFVSRINAARYCNFLTTGDPAQGPYRIGNRARENGEIREAIIGQRDLTFRDEARVYTLPGLSEFYKAGWYGGAAGWRTLTPETRKQPSHYGLQDHATGLREWIDDKYRRGSTFALGAADADTRPDVINANVSFQIGEHTGNERTGFRVIATAPLQIGDRLNRHDNFFWQNEKSATLRVRLDDTPRQETFRLVLRDFANREIWSRETTQALRPGVTELPIPLPQTDGYYELSVTPADPSFGGQAVVIPLAVMNTPMPAQGADGNFGFTHHITRTEKRFTFEEYNFDLLRRLGVSQVRVDVRYDDIDGNQSALRRIREAGFNPLAIITRNGLREPDDIRNLMAEHPDLAAKWARHGIPSEFAWHAEQVWRLVDAHKDVVRDWEYVNEPTYIRITAEDYTQAMKAAYIAAKLADPGCNLMAGDLNAIHAPVLQLGGGAFFDSVSSHIYGFYVPSFWGIPGKMRELNGWLAAAGVAQKPVWITEIAACTYNAYHLLPVRTVDETRRYQALHQPKTMAGSMAFGAAKVLPYNFRDVPVETREGLFGVLDRHGLPKPAAMSFRTTAMLIGDARFVGFLKGHSFADGQVAGLLFRDRQERDVLVLWRNDLYSRGRFDIPFFDIIKPPGAVTVRSRAPRAELFDLTGGASALPTGPDGRLSIPVSEYPVFVRGQLDPELADVATVHPVAPIQLPAVRVKILNNEPQRAADLMTGVTLNLVEKTKSPVEVRVYNISNRPVTGVLRLEPMAGWREWPWKIAPGATTLSIPAHGMATARFEIPVPALKPGNRPHLLNAIFSGDAGAEFRDTVILQTTARTIRLADWRTYSRGFRLQALPNDASLRIAWDAERASYASFYRQTLQPFADEESALKKPVVLTFESAKAGVRAVSLLFKDRENETFQIKRPVRQNTEGQGRMSVRFDPEALLKPGVIVHSGGNGQVDFPVRLLGFNFDLNPDRTEASGTITVHPVEIGGTSGGPDEDALGGVEDGL